MLNIYEMLIKRSRSVEPPASDIPTDYFLYMPFDTDLLDHSDYERSFTTTGTAPTLETVDGIKCATFPVNTYMRSSDTTGFTGNGNVTLSMWLKIDAIPSNQWNFLFCIGQSGSSKKCTSIGLESSTKYGGGIWGGNGNTQVTPCDVDTNWHHVCYVFNEDSNRVYLDGVMIWKSTTTDTLNIEGGGWGINNTSTQFSYTPGVVVHYADVRAYYRTITSEELWALASEHQTIASIPTDFVFYARLDDKSAIVTESGQTITHYGSIDSYIENDKVKGIDCIRSTNTDASNSFKIDDTGFPTGNSARSISIWGYGTASASAAFKDGWSLCKYGTTEVVNYSWFRFYPSSIDNCNGSYSVTYTRDPNAWHNYTVTFDGAGRLEFFVDGLSIGYVTNASFTTLLDALYIFGDGWRGYWSGCLASLRIYDRALTATEIALLATEFTPLSEVAFNNQSVQFAYSAGSSTSTLVTNPAGCTFEIASGTLPDGVTFNTSTGVLSYDGSEITQDETYTLTITASKPGYVSKTSTVTINMLVEASIPLDYMLYVPLVENDATTAESGQSLTYYGTPVETTIAGIPCLDMRGVTISAPDTGLNMGTDPISICIWAYGISSTSWGTIAFMGTNNSNGKKVVIVNSISTTGEIGGDFHNYYYSSGVKYVGAWHCIVLTKSGTNSTIYIDGVQAATYTSQYINTQSSGVFRIGGVAASSPNSYGYMTACRVYNRVLTADEIALIAGEFTPQYEITAQDLSFSLYQKNETYGITYTSPAGTPTFEIIEGTLPSSITFNTATGQFTGKGLTDADHTYSLKVRLTAPNSTPATVNVSISTYMTARIWINSKFLYYWTDGSGSSSFDYTSDEAVTFALETGSTLPSGITMSGNTFTCDGTTPAGTYSVVVRGTSEHNQTGVTATEYLSVTANVVTVTTTTLKFYAPKGVVSKQVAYTTSHYPITPVYTITGTLPAGITFDSSTGEFTSDGTQSVDETQSVSVEVASSTGLSTAGTGTVSIEVYREAPAIPDDYVFYAPLSSDYTDHSEYNRTVNYVGSAPTFVVDESIPCASFTSSQALYTSGTTGMESGNYDRTISAWFKTTRNTNNWQVIMCYGYPAGYQELQLTYYQGNVRGCIWNFDTSPTFSLDGEWHHYLETYSASNRNVCFYVDGVLISSNYASSNLSLPSSGFGVGMGCHINGSDRPNNAYKLAAVRAYDRVLISEEISTLSSEFTPTPQVTFTNQTATFVYSGGSSTHTLVTDPTGCTFSLASGTLPNGVTLDTATGVLSYDGTVVSQDSTTTVTITASKTGYLSNTATITIKMLVEVHTVRFWAGVDTTLYLTNTDGVFVATPSGSWGGTGYHSDLHIYPEIYFYPKHGLKYSIDGGSTWNDWIFEDTSSTLDLSSIGTTITSLTKISGRDTVSLTGQQIMVNDPSGSSAPYVFDVELEPPTPTEITFNDQTFYLDNCTSWSDSLTASCTETLTFTSDGNEPSGVTVGSDGSISCDGTTTADEYTFNVTATCQGNQTGETATITLIVTEPTISVYDQGGDKYFYNADGSSSEHIGTEGGTYYGNIDWYITGHNGETLPSSISMDSNGNLDFDGTSECDWKGQVDVTADNASDVNDHGYPYIAGNTATFWVEIYANGNCPECGEPMSNGMCRNLSCTEYVEDEKTCDNCSNTLHGAEEDECWNEDCPESPFYVEELCQTCNEPMTNHECTNPLCPENPSYDPYTVPYVTFDQQEFKFVGGSSGTATLVASPSGCTFTTSDTLPSGVTLGSDGTLTFDGSTVSTDDTVSISVEASASGYYSTTQTITLTLWENPTMPSVSPQYELLLDTKANTHFTGHTSDDDYLLTTYTANHYAYDTIDGITAFKLSKGYTAWNTSYGSTTLSATGNAMSIWMRIYGVVSKTGCLINASNSGTSPFAITIKKYDGEYYYYIAYKLSSVHEYSTQVVADNKWHHFVVNFTKSTRKLDFWIDGELKRTFNLSMNISKNQHVTFHALTQQNSTTPDGHFDQTVYYRNYQWYTRPLTNGEIRGLSTVLTPNN